MDCSSFSWHTITASQEGYFAEMKKRIFEGIALPCSAIRFLKEHINDLYSGTNEVATKLKHFNHNYRQLVPTTYTSEKGLGSVSQKPARTQHSTAKRSESTRQKAVSTSCSFDELRFLSQGPAPTSCSFDSELGNFLQDPTPAACISSDQHSEFSPQMSVPPQCSADIESSVRKPILNSADGKVKSSSQKSNIHMNFDSISLLRERARMVNDSDLKSSEAWKGFVNKNSFFADVNEQSPENQEKSKNIQDTSEILSELLDFESNNNANIINRNYLYIPNNNNTHNFPTNYKKDKLFVKNESTLTAELLTSKPIFTSTPLIDHNYTKSLSDKKEVSTELYKSDKENLNPKCKNKPAKVGFYFQSYPQIRFLNERLDNGGKRGFLLKNGLKLGIIKVNNIAVDLQKTCGFDAIIHLLQFGALYDSQYHFCIQYRLIAH
ncbi:uncharacterized protein LOC105203267 [Solenopsis invicta]|uniref:uncharacterized protein LOC105203267 n=1 Tax=Solenopsis invicta TaxID=13686 RepID=UPI00193CA27E|nr:uncharacterized protein LOC105203267 [Solenopsis invicta]